MKSKIKMNRSNKIKSTINGLDIVPIPHTLIPPIQNNPPPCSPLLSSLYESLSPLPSPVLKKSMIEIEEIDDVESDIEMQSLSSQQPLKSALQTL